MYKDPYQNSNARCLNKVQITESMRVLYISAPAFLDLDLSFIKSLSAKVDLYFLFDLYPSLLKVTALDMDKVYDQAGIRRAEDYEGLKIYSDFLSLKKTYVVNRISDKWYSLSNFKLHIQLWKFVRKLNPDIIHFNNHVYFNHFYLFFFKRKRLLINIHDAFPHSGEELSFKAKLQRYVNNKLVRNHLLFNSVLKDGYVNKNNLHEKNIYISSLGIYEYLNHYKKNNEDTISDVLFFGRISKYKGVDDLLEAFQIVLKEFPDAKLVIAGSGKFWFDTNAYNIPEKNLKIINRYIPPSELSSLIQNSKFVVCPYKDATQSGVTMSAYALRKPVIATKVGGLVEMVDDSETGILVSPNSPRELANAICELLRDQHKRQEMESQIDSHYYKGSRNWDSITNKTVDIYRAIMNDI